MNVERALSVLAREEASSWKMAWRIRRVEERLLALFSAGKLQGTVHTCIGQEWVGVTLAEALDDGDLIFSNHRCHGHYLARTGDVPGLIAELMGKATGVCGGKGGSQHLCADNFFSNGVQGGIAPVSAGLALAQAQLGRPNIVVACLGDGTLGEGVVYETMNLAAKWSLPLLLLLENNQYAQSTSQSQTLAGTIAGRAQAFGIRFAQADTWDIERLRAAMREAVACVRGGPAPFLLQVDTYRLSAHSKGDDSRAADEVEAYRQRDLLNTWARDHADDAKTLAAGIDAEIAAAEAAAEAAPCPGEPAVEELPEVLHWAATRFEARSARVADRIHAGLAEAMAADPRVLLIGEDIEGPYGGAFKITRDLSQRYPGRVRNTPISEAAIVGLGNGLALAGLRPVCEIMFGDFLMLAADQLINHASKFAYMYNEQVSVPLIVRTPMGGKRGYGPTHSQSLEKHFLGVPGIQVLALHALYDPADIYAKLFATIERPTLLIENKLLYGARLGEQQPRGFALEHSDEVFPTTRLRPPGAVALTIVCYGGMLGEAAQAADRLFQEHDVLVEVICPVQLYPLNVAAVLGSLERTGRLLIVEEGQGFAAFGSEVLAQVSEHAPELLKRARRVSAAPCPIPASQPLERAVLPTTEHIMTAALEVVRG